MSDETGEKLSGILRSIKNNLTTDNNPIVGTLVVVNVGNEYIGGISNAALSIGVVLTRAPLPDLCIVNVSFAGRMVVTQESARENRHRVFAVGNASEFTTKMGVDIVGKVLVSHLYKRCVKFHKSGRKKFLYGPHPWKSVTVESDGKTGDVQREEDSIQEGNCCAK